MSCLISYLFVCCLFLFCFIGGFFSQNLYYHQPYRMTHLLMTIYPFITIDLFLYSSRRKLTSPMCED